MITYEGENLDQKILPVLSLDVPNIVLITHDKSVFYVNNGIVKAWGPANKSRLHRKSQGLSIYVSDFLHEFIGRLWLVLLTRPLGHEVLGNP